MVCRQRRTGIKPKKSGDSTDSKRESSPGPSAQVAIKQTDVAAGAASAATPSPTEDYNRTKRKVNSLRCAVLARVPLLLIFVAAVLVLVRFFYYRHIHAESVETDTAFADICANGLLERMQKVTLETEVSSVETYRRCEEALIKAKKFGSTNASREHYINDHALADALAVFNVIIHTGQLISDVIKPTIELYKRQTTLVACGIYAIIALAICYCVHPLIQLAHSIVDLRVAEKTGEQRSRDIAIQDTQKPAAVAAAAAATAAITVAAAVKPPPAMASPPPPPLPSKPLYSMEYIPPSFYHRTSVTSPGEGDFAWGFPEA